MQPAGVHRQLDDATGRLMNLQFVESESTFAYFHATPRLPRSLGQAGCFLQRQAWGVSRQPDRFYRLTEGQRVAVDVIDGRKGPEAAGLRLI